MWSSEHAPSYGPLSFIGGPEILSLSTSINVFRLDDRTTKYIPASNRVPSHHNQEIKKDARCFQLGRGENPAGRERRTLQVPHSQFPSTGVSRTICFTYRFYLFVDCEVAVMLGWWPSAGRTHADRRNRFHGNPHTRLSFTIDLYDFQTLARFRR